MNNALPDADCSPASQVTPNPSPGIDIGGATQGWPYFNTNQPVNAINCGADGISMYLAPVGVRLHNPTEPPNDEPYVLGPNFIVVVETGDDADWIGRMCAVRAATGMTTGVTVYNTTYDQTAQATRAKPAAC